ncbi:MAG: NAD(P)H-hydrate dehydratase [Rhodobacteraceae bacterium]|nr:MAG: NAD(P)H-hydrate dehydratase [Paracoccaceae bacterium]
MSERATGAVLLTAAEMRAVEAAAIDSASATGLALMERAGGATVDAALATWPDLAARPHRATVLCGPGANGGDGYVVARRFAERGWAVAVRRLGDPAKATGDAAAMRAAWLALGQEAPLSEPAPSADLVVDALFGTGLAREVPAEACGALAAARAGGARVLAVDAPLGLCLDTGRGLPAAVQADLTVSFHRPKIGHVVGAGPAACGALRVVDIGLEPFAAAAADAARTVEGPAFDPRKSGARHKYDYGHALVLAGGVGRGGAARLAARAALRVGAGLVTVGAPGAALIENAARLDAVMLRRTNDAADLRALLEDRRVTALALGPGLGVDGRTADLVAVAAEASLRGVGVALDADALTALASAGGFPPFGPRVVLTPHAGEFARLFPALDAAGDPAAAARAAAAASGATVLLKGAATVIAAPDGALRVHGATGPRAAPWLATAGSGDVLTGLAAGLLARGAGALDAAATAAWLHVEAARVAGPGLIAEDLPEALPRVLRALEQGGESGAGALGAVWRVG